MLLYTKPSPTITATAEFDPEQQPRCIDQLHNMEYYDDDDYIRASPELTPFQPDLGGCPPLSFPPSWLFQEICETPPVDAEGTQITSELT